MDVEYLKYSINLVDFLYQMGMRPAWLSLSGERAMFYSPLREEKNPSFSVFRTPSGVWMWKDWGTGKTGDIISLVQEYHSVSFREAVEMLGGDELPPFPKPIPFFSPGRNLLKKVLSGPERCLPSGRLLLFPVGIGRNPCRF